MRILFTVDTFPPRCGGSGWSAFEQARALIALGHEVTVVRPGRGGEERIEGIRVIEVPTARARLPLLRHIVARELQPRRFREALVALLRREPHDLVHAHHVVTGIAGIEAARACRIPSVITIRDYWPVCFWGTRMSGESRCPGCSPLRIVRCLISNSPASTPLSPAAAIYVVRYLARLRRALGQAGAVIAISNRIKQELLSFLPADAVTVIPNFTEMPPLRPPLLRPPYITFAGKLTAMKGVDELIEALTRARLDLPVVFIGDGPMKRVVKKAIASGAIRGRIEGWVDRDRMFEIISGGLFNLFPSRWDEPLGRVVIEAAAMGRTSVILEQGGPAGPRELLEDGISGVFARSVDEFAASIGRLAADPALAAELGAAARRRVEERFSARMVTTALLSVYGKGLGARD